MSAATCKLRQQQARQHPNEVALDPCRECPGAEKLEEAVEVTAPLAPVQKAPAQKDVAADAPASVPRTPAKGGQRSPQRKSRRARLALQIGRLLQARARRLHAAQRQSDSNAVFQAARDVLDLAELLVTLVGGDEP